MVNHEGKANRRFQRAVQVRKHAPESLPEEHQGEAPWDPDTSHRECKIYMVSLVA